MNATSAAETTTTSSAVSRGRASRAAGQTKAGRTLPSPASNHDFEHECLPHRRELLAAAMRMTRNAEDARDLVQETLLRAFVAWPSLRRDSNCRAWLFRILTNSFINIYRRRRHRRQFAREFPNDAMTAFYGDAVGHTGTPEDELVGGMLGDEVSEALADLADEQRQVVEMADLQGIGYREIAESLGVPLGTIMSRLFRARRKLEVELADFAADDYGIRRAA